MGYLQMAVQVGLTLAAPVINYSASTIKGHAAMGTLHNIKNGVEDMGMDIAGPVIGKAVGNFLGRAVAGHNIEAAEKVGTVVADAFEIIGNQALNVANDHLQAKKTLNAVPLNSEDLKASVAKQTVDYKAAAFKTAQALGTMGGGLAIATGLAPFAPVGLVLAATQAFPKIADSLFKPIEKEKNLNLMDDVVAPLATQVAIQTAGHVVQGVVQYNSMQNAYELASKKGEYIAKGLTYWLPQSIQDQAAKLGGLIGHIDAGRQVMTKEVLEDVKNKGLLAKEVTELGLKTIDTAVKMKKAENEKTGMWKTAKNVGIVTAGVLSGAALVALTPELALPIGGMALLSVSHNAIKWARQQVGDNKKDAMVAEPLPVIDEVAEEVALEKPSEKQELSLDFINEIIKTPPQIANAAASAA